MIINFYTCRVDNAFLVSLVGLRPEKHFWLGLSNEVNIDVFSWTNTEHVRFTHWNAGMPGAQSCEISHYNIKHEQQPNSFNSTSVPLNAKVTNKGVLPWQLGFRLDSGMCCPAPIRRNTSASTWQRGQFQQFHHQLKLLLSVLMVGIELEQEASALRYKYRI